MPAPDYLEADWYDSPLYYDLIFDQNTASEADFIAAAWARHGDPGQKTNRKRVRILEPACGSGRLMNELAGRGHRVAGFDRNKAMLGAARKRLAAAGRRGVLKAAPMESFVMPGLFDIAHCLLSTFKYILDEVGAVGHLRCVSDHLRPGGIYVLGMHLTDYKRTRCEHERWTGSRDGLQVVCNTRTWPADRKRRREKLRTRLRVQHDGETSERCLETHWECRTYSEREFFRLLARVPALQPVAFYDFHHDIDQPKPAGRGSRRDDVVFVLQKPRP